MLQPVRRDVLILALDLSQNVGFAVGRIGDAAPRLGLWLLPPPGEDLGRFGASYENELIDVLEDQKPDRVVTAASLPPAAQTNALSMEAQIGLLMLTRCACYRHRIQHVVRAEATARKRVLGTGRFKAGEVKGVVMDWCARRGWAAPSHDAADAAVLWQFESLMCGAKAPGGGGGRGAARQQKQAAWPFPEHAA